jgi:hypothetical protein
MAAGIHDDSLGKLGPADRLVGAVHAVEEVLLVCPPQHIEPLRPQEQGNRTSCLEAAMGGSGNYIRYPCRCSYA